MKRFVHAQPQNNADEMQWQTKTEKENKKTSRAHLRACPVDPANVPTPTFAPVPLTLQRCPRPPSRLSR